MLDWISDPALRRRINAGLNKGEARNALARRVLSLWNTIYLGQAVDELRSRGEIIPDEILAHAAPLGWEHIALNGDYVWPHDTLETFRPLRNPRAEFLDAA